MWVTLQERLIALKQYRVTLAFTHETGNYLNFSFLKLLTNPTAVRYLLVINESSNVTKIIQFSLLKYEKQRVLRAAQLLLVCKYKE